MGHLPALWCDGTCPAAAEGAAPTSNGHSEEVGHDVDLPAEVLLDPHTVLSDHYAQVTGVAPSSPMSNPSFLACTYGFR